MKNIASETPYIISEPSFIAILPRKNGAKSIIQIILHRINRKLGPVP